MKAYKLISKERIKRWPFTLPDNSVVVLHGDDVLVTEHDMSHWLGVLLSW
jgi:hypothetical protein